ncbi:hypothetical protein [Streptomyces sp. NPDC005485]|uniref:hypothetical protein n=1 Tax=Streptomyces sp. NPDC005485 TaxID=3155591 RepID=UPI0033A62922
MNALNFPRTLRRRIVSLLIVAAALAVGASIGVRLASYGVPWLLLTACALSAVSSALWLFGRIEQALTTTTHRCTAPRCTFQARVQHVDAAENRRWQEIAAAHPRHDA